MTDYTALVDAVLAVAKAINSLAFVLILGMIFGAFRK